MKRYTSAKAASLAIVCLFFAACGGGGNGNNDSGGTPPTGAPLTEPDRASSATIGSGGGTVSATGLNGVTYTLDVPVGALDQAVEIRLTPISDMGDAPLADNTFGAVQFEPSGLRFSHPATLRISALPTLAGGRRLVGFTSNNDGGAFRLDLARVEGDSTLVNVSHFSAGGAAEATVDELPPIVDIAPDLRGADDAIAQLAALTARDAGLVDIVDVFRQWYIEIVQPALNRADGATDIALQTDAIAQYQSWIATMDYIDDRDSLNIALADELNEAAPIATRIFTALIDRELASCGDLSSDVPTRLTALARASNAQNRARRVGLDSAGSGLDRATFLLRVNECVQVMLDPISLPSPLSIGTDFSLDAQAKIIFNGSPTPDGAPFAFRVDPTGATVPSPEGFSDGEGRYTTVFRPTANTVTLDVRACLVFPSGVMSDLCATQEARGSADTGTVQIMSKFTNVDGLIVTDTVQTVDRNNFATPGDPDVPFIDAVSLSDGDIVVTASSTSDSISATAGGNLSGGATCKNGGTSGYSTQLLINVTRTTTLSYEGSVTVSGSVGSHAAGINLSGPTSALFDDLNVPGSRSIELEPGSHTLALSVRTDCRGSVFGTNNLVGADKTATVNLSLRF